MPIRYGRFKLELTLLRNRFKEDYTAGQLYIDGVYFCFTLEDKVREQDGVPIEKWKIYGQTAIPQGIYEVFLDDSPKFGPQTLTLKDVPGFSKIRIHSGNTSVDTEGCIIVGYRLNNNGVIVPGTTKKALLDLKKLVTLPCKISIVNTGR